MTLDPFSADPPRGAPSPTPQRWGLRETASAIGVAAVIAALGGAAIYAATEPASHDGPSALAHGIPAGPPPGLSRPNDGTPPALHGEFVVADGVGGYSTMLAQTGTVTQVSPTSITVRSADEFTQSYVIPSGAEPDRSIVADDEVVVHAKRVGGAATATSVTQRLAPGVTGQPSPPN